MAVRNSLKINSAKKLFQPISLVPKDLERKRDLVPKSQRLMTDYGIVRQSSSGMFHLLPLGKRSVDKLTELVHHHLDQLGAQRIHMPLLTHINPWHLTNRLDKLGAELMRCTDRQNREYLLSPTHEESVSELIGSLPAIPHSQLPLLLYQTSPKFRDEMKPRCGLLRSREFLMNDLYSFDSSNEDAAHTYERVCQAYHQIFDDIGVPYLKVVGSSGMMGGDLSHEYHIAVDIGEDTLRICDKCGEGFNLDVSQSSHCFSCGGTSLSSLKAIEVGHTFMLGTRYSKPLSAKFKSSDNKELPLIMCSYGLGLTRILAACLEFLSPSQSLRWPPRLAPYSVVVITPKAGSKEYERGMNLGYDVYTRLDSVPQLKGDVLLDDRGDMTIGRRLHYNRSTGYPHVVVIGKKTLEAPVPLLEVHSTEPQCPTYLPLEQLVDFLLQKSLLCPPPADQSLLPQSEQSPQALPLAQPQ